MMIKVISHLPRIGKTVLAFSGWPDAGGLSKHWLAEIQRQMQIQLVADWDLDGYWTAQSQRPRVEVNHGQIRRLVWPQFCFYAGPSNSGEAALFGTGPEPSHRWHQFTETLLKSLRQWGCRELLLLGSLYDQIFHDEIKISAIVHDVDGFNTARSWNCSLIEYEGPSAIHSAIMEAAKTEGISCISLWAHLPFYVKDFHELVLHRVLTLTDRFLGQSWNRDHLLEAWEKHAKQIEAALEENPDLNAPMKTAGRSSGHFKDHSERGNVIHLEDFFKGKKDPDGTET